MIKELTDVDEENSSVASDDMLTADEEANASASFLGNKISATAREAKAHSLSDQMDAEEIRNMVLEEGAIVVLDGHKEADV